MTWLFIGSLEAAQFPILYSAMFVILQVQRRYVFTLCTKPCCVTVHRQHGDTFSHVTRLFTGIMETRFLWCTQQCYATVHRYHGDIFSYGVLSDLIRLFQSKCTTETHFYHGVLGGLIRLFTGTTETHFPLCIQPCYATVYR